MSDYDRCSCSRCQCRRAGVPDGHPCDSCASGEHFTGLPTPDTISGNNLSDDLEQTGIDLWNKAASVPEGEERQRFLDASIAVQAVVAGEQPAHDAALLLDIYHEIDDLRTAQDGSKALEVLMLGARANLATLMPRIAAALAQPAEPVTQPIDEPIYLSEGDLCEESHTLVINDDGTSELLRDFACCSDVERSAGGSDD